MRLRNILYPHLRCQISETILPGVALIISIHQLTGIKDTVTDDCRRLCVVCLNPKIYVACYRLPVPGKLGV